MLLILFDGLRLYFLNIFVFFLNKEKRKKKIEFNIFFYITGAIMHVGVAADVKDLFEICSSAFYQLFQRNIISKVFQFYLIKINHIYSYNNSKDP